MYLIEFLHPVGNASTPKGKETIDELPEIENDFIDDINSQNFVGSNQVNETDDIEVPKNLHCDPNVKSIVSNLHGLGTGVRNDVSKKSNEKAVTRNTR